MIIVVALYLVIMIMDFSPIIKEKKVKEFIINIIFLIPSFIFVFFIIKGITVKSWLIIICEFLKSLGFSY